VVKGLRYSDKKFVAQYHYLEKGGTVMEGSMKVTDDWVFDTYGKEIAQRIINQGEHREFITPLDAKGQLVMVPFDTQKVTRVKYVPPKTREREDEGGVQQTEICAKGVWSGLLEDKSFCTLTEETVAGLGNDFVTQCIRLGARKFVPIPVGSCGFSLIIMYPHLRCENAPPVNFQQGVNHTCILSSLASAFDHTGIPELVRAAKMLHDQTKKVSKGTKGDLLVAKHIVEENLLWLQPKKISKDFDWENDINDYMFVLLCNSGQYILLPACSDHFQQLDF
jgi:hypothetical protein